MRQFETAEDVVGTLSPETPVYCFRPDVLRKNAREFLTGFPGEILYAVKCNPHPAILRQLHQAGVQHFDTASLPEIALVSEHCPGAESYFMHPVKGRRAIRAAFGVYGTRHFVIDHLSELNKIEEEIPGRLEDVVIMVRMATSGESAFFNLSEKFGATPEECVELLQVSERRGHPVGLCFHVGSQCTRAEGYSKAIVAAGEIVSRSGTAVRWFDVGGGFPRQYQGPKVPETSVFFDAIKEGLNAVSLPGNCAILCEPGRALAGDCMSLIVQVQLRKDDKLYINDGVYGSLITAAIGVELPVRRVGQSEMLAPEPMAFSVYGPTCDNLDSFKHRIALPSDVREGDWLEFGCAGAYASALRTDFNGFRPETFVEVKAPFDLSTVAAPFSEAAAQ